MIDLIGTPFKKGGRSEQEGFDCYGLLREMYRRVRGIDLPNHQTGESQEDNAARITVGMPGWVRCERKPNVAILIRIGRRLCHIGFTIDNNRFIHAWESSGGVTIERFDDWNHRIFGFYDYQPVLDHQGR